MISLLHMSVSAAILILLIIGVRALTIDRLPKKTFSALWGIALLRLLTPFALPALFALPGSFTTSELIASLGIAPGSDQQGNEQSAAGQTQGLPAGTAGAAPSGSPTGNTPIGYPAGSAPADHPTQASDTAGSLAISPWLLLWLAGAALCALYFIAAYVRMRRAFSTSIPVQNDAAIGWLDRHKIGRPVEIRCLSGVAAPLTFGILHPVILVPEDTNWSGADGQLDFILEHEFVHIKRFDAMTKLLLAAAFCVHWFNPAVWAMYLIANRDMELACDEAVIKRLGKKIKAAYALVLIGMEETKNKAVPLVSSFSKTAAEERITSIMKFNKKSKFTVCAAAFLAIVALCGATFIGPRPGPDPGFASRPDPNSGSKSDADYGVGSSDAHSAGKIAGRSLSSTAGRIAGQRADSPIQRGENENEIQSSLPLTRGSQAVIYESVTLMAYDDGAPYIHDIRINATDKKLVASERGMLAFDKEGNPLKIDWNGMDSDYEPSYGFLYDWGSDNIRPGARDDVRGGWSLDIWDADKNAAKIAYVLYCDKSVTFEDGTVWENPGYDDWLKTYGGKKTDVSLLRNYYPYVELISEQ